MLLQLLRSGAPRREPRTPSPLYGALMPSQAFSSKFSKGRLGGVARNTLRSFRATAIHRVLRVKIPIAPNSPQSSRAPTGHRASVRHHGRQPHKAHPSLPRAARLVSEAPDVHACRRDTPKRHPSWAAHRHARRRPRWSQSVDGCRVPAYWPGANPASLVSNQINTQRKRRACLLLFHHRATRPPSPKCEPHLGLRSAVYVSAIRFIPY